MKTTLLAASLLAVAGFGQALAQGASTGAPAEPAPDSSAATWQMPLQLSPASLATASGEPMFTALVPGTGVVRGTREALAGLGTPLREAPGANRAVKVCQDVVASEAMKIGARAVEAASAGPHRRARGGKMWGPVRMRITYARSGGYEVREATMICVMDRRGKLLDAYV